MGDYSYRGIGFIAAIFAVSFLMIGAVIGAAITAAIIEYDLTVEVSHAPEE